MVSGVPIGDAQFVRCKLGEVVQRLVSDNDNLVIVVNALQNVAPQHLSAFSITVLTLNLIIGYSIVIQRTSVRP